MGCYFQWRQVVSTCKQAMRVRRRRRLDKHWQPSNPEKLSNRLAQKIEREKRMKSKG